MVERAGVRPHLLRTWSKGPGSDPGSSSAEPVGVVFLPEAGAEAEALLLNVTDSFSPGKDGQADDEHDTQHDDYDGDDRPNHCLKLTSGV